MRLKPWAQVDLSIIWESCTSLSHLLFLLENLNFNTFPILTLSFWPFFPNLENRNKEISTGSWHHICLFTYNCVCSCLSPSYMLSLLCLGLTLRLVLDSIPYLIRGSRCSHTVHFSLLECSHQSAYKHVISSMLKKSLIHSHPFRYHSFALYSKTQELSTYTLYFSLLNPLQWRFWLHWNSCKYH